MTTKPLLSLPNTSSSSQICKDEQKCYWIGAGMIILFGSTLKVYFFQLPKLKNVVGGGGVEVEKWLRVPGDKKAQNRLYVAPHAVSHSMPQRPQNVIKKKQRRNAGY